VRERHYTTLYCDSRGQIKGTAHTFTSFIVRSVSMANIERT